MVCGASADNMLWMVSERAENRLGCVVVMRTRLGLNWCIWLPLSLPAGKRNWKSETVEHPLRTRSDAQRPDSLGSGLVLVS
jgi:hypothetical protein